MARVYCGTCDYARDALELIYPVPSLEERILPGDPMPLGECPDCGELVFSNSIEEEEG